MKLFHAERAHWTLIKLHGTTPNRTCGECVKFGEDTRKFVNWWKHKKDDETAMTCARAHIGEAPEGSWIPNWNGSWQACGKFVKVGEAASEIRSR